MSEHNGNGCYHCGLLIPDYSIEFGVINGGQRKFCCHGCRSVCQVIYESGMGGFYDRTPDGVSLAPPPEPPEEITLFDHEEVQSEYIQISGDVHNINLLVEGIHCAACVWLIERTLSDLSGVISAHVNLTGRRLHLSWRDKQVKLSDIIQKLSMFGYSATPFDPETLEGRLKKADRSLIYRLVFSGFTMMNLLWISIALYSGADESEFKDLFHWLGFLLATPTLLYSGYPFLKGAWTSLITRHLTMDLPIAIGATTSYIYSTYITIIGSQIGQVYFDTVVNFIFVILIGRYLESIAKRKAVSSTQRLMDLQPRVAIRLIDAKEEVVSVRLLKIKDVLRIKPGQRIPVDGTIITGMSEVNESMLSGESIPVVKRPKDSVYAGTVNGNGVIEINVEGILSNTALGKIINLVEHAQTTKPPIQCTADLIVPWFISATLLLATVTFLFWLNTGFEIALMAATSVLIITCPCAFGLATPMAIAVASGVGARNGVLIKNGGVLEKLSSIRHYVFDKTGTLTDGILNVRKTHIEPGYSINKFYCIAYALEILSEHPIAKAIIDKAHDLGINEGCAENFSYTPGSGVSGVIAGNEVLLGNASWMRKHNIVWSSKASDFISHHELKSESVIFLAENGHCIGVASLFDKLRKNAPSLLRRLQNIGIRLTVLTGDSKNVAEATVNNLGVELEVISEILPKDKADVISNLQSNGKQIAMVGDGINDAPALTVADVGIAMGSGTDVSVESADIVLLNSELEKVEFASLLSQKTLTTIRQNIGISIIYNVIMVPLAMMAYITPLVAAVSMPISSLLVIGNAYRISIVVKSSNENGWQWK
jgi:Cu2+-exporting ATPase